MTQEKGEGHCTGKGAQALHRKRGTGVTQARGQGDAEGR